MSPIEALSECFTGTKQSAYCFNSKLLQIQGEPYSVGMPVPSHGNKWAETLSQLVPIAFGRTGRLENLEFQKSGQRSILGPR